VTALEPAQLAELLTPEVGVVLTAPLTTSAGVLPAGHLIGVRYRAGLGGVDIYAGVVPEPVAMLAGPADLCRHGVRLPSADDERRALTAAREAGEL
jgi:hypothetical protein